MSAAPLQGLRVVDFTRVLAGPHCTKALRDLGADVTKIEPPSGDLGRVGLPYVNGIGLYYVQQNAGKRNLSIDLTMPRRGRSSPGFAATPTSSSRISVRARLRASASAMRTSRRSIRASFMCRSADTARATSWRNRPAFAPTVQAETGLTAIVQDHFGEALTEPRGDSCSHADVYTGLQGVIAVLAALHHRERTGEGQHVDVSMAATMLSVNERAGAMLSDIDTDGEPIALSANESHIFEMADGTQLTIAASPIYSPMFTRYCAMMRRSDLLADPRYATAKLRRENLPSLLSEIRAWLATFDSLEQLQAQVSEAGLAVGRVRTVNEFAASEWVKEWNAVVEVDDRAGGTLRMPGNPWIFSHSELPPPGAPAYQGEHNEEILKELQISDATICDMQEKNVILSSR